MVKGVSKTVIVVNNTGNKYFEKIVFYVTPEYGNLSSGHLNSAARKFISTLDTNNLNNNKSLRKCYKKKRIIRFFLYVLGFLVLSSVLIVFFCK